MSRRAEKKSQFANEVGERYREIEYRVVKFYNDDVV